MAQDFLIDGFSILDSGMNSGVLPQLLPPNQSAFATNSTYRGGYITHRPPFRRMKLDYGGDTTIQNLFSKNNFQGACYYQPDYTPQSLMAAVGGRLFQLTPDAASNNVTVQDVTIPNDPNPASPQIAWLWQAERWVIWMDGQSVPVFFDGTNSRRSTGDSKVLGTLQNNFTNPAINGTVNIDLTAAYPGQIGDIFTIGSSTYQVVPSGVTPNVTLTELYDTGAVHPIGASVIINPNVFGVQAVTITFGSGIAGHTFASGTLQITLTLTQNYTGGNGVAISLFGKKWTVSSSSGQYVLIKNQQKITMPNTLDAGTLVYLNGTSFPINTIGTLTVAFTPPGLGSSGNANLSANFTGTDGQVVYIENSQYTIAAIPPPPPGSTITVKNINGNPGDTINAGSNLLSIAELPPGRMGVYGMGRNWIALTDGFSFMAGDIVGGPSGSETFDFRDSVLKSTENTYLAGGGNFRVPSGNGQISAMRFSTTLDVALGQGPLQVFTPYGSFSCNAPVDRTIWQTITNPILTESLIGYGGEGQASTQVANGDILFRGIDGIRSLILARRDFDTWGNVPISREMDRIVSQDNANLLPFASATQFQNRFLMSSIPTTGQLGTYHKGLMVMNFDPISSLRGKSASIYDGLWTGLNVFQMVTGIFNGTLRCFAFCYNSFDNEIELWEILQQSDSNRFDNGNQPITWSFETASLFQNVKGKGQFDQIELLDGEVWFRDIRGVVHFQSWYRSSFSQCWIPWKEFDLCGNNLDASKPAQERTRIGLGVPDIKDCDPTTNRPYRIGENFQFRFQITGSCKIMGAQFKAKPTPETRFSVPHCETLCIEPGSVQKCESCEEQGDCLSFDDVFYNLNDGKIYTFNIPNFGESTYTFPYPIGGNNGPIPPFIMNVDSLYSIVREIPPDVTQEQIDQIIQNISTIDTGNSITFTNDATASQFSCDVGVTPNFTGTLPEGVTSFTIGNVITFIAREGLYYSNSKDSANQIAQSVLDGWVQSQVNSGALSCPSLLNGLIQYYALNESAGSSRLDQNGAYPLSEVVNPVGTMSGISSLGLAVVPSPSNFRLQNLSPNPSISFQNTSYSFSIWINRLLPTSLTSIASYFVNMTSSSPFQGWGLQSGNGNNTLLWFLRLTGGGVIHATEIPISQNVWTHYAVTYDLASQALNHYINGTLYATDSSFPAVDSDETSRRLTVGGTGSVSNAYFGAQAVGMWSRALTASEIAQLYNSGNGLPYPF